MRSGYAFTLQLETNYNAAFLNAPPPLEVQDYWWPLSFIAYPFLGRIWCSICPFMIYGELVQRWRLSTGAQLLKWPRQQLDAWGGWFLFWLFAGILVWEEVWDLPDTAYLSSALLLLITAGAMICSWFFEKRMWCRYLCPIGGMNVRWLNGVTFYSVEQNYWWRCLLYFAIYAAGHVCQAVDD